MATVIRRRKFLGRLSAGAAGLAAASVSTSVLGANDAVRVACIGTGGRSLRQLLPALLKVPGIRVTAACDVWDRHLAEAKQAAGGEVFTTKHYPEALARSDVDAVMIATPDHLHVPITVAACEAKKDVYVEKPLTHDLAEGQAVIAAQNRHGRIVQVGTQQRSMPQFQKGLEVIQSGALGKVRKVHLTWNRNAALGAARSSYGIDPKTVEWKRFLGAAKDQPFDEWRFRNWRWCWDFGGGIFTDLMVHHIDIVHWYLGIDHPSAAVSLGDHFQTRGLWETPDSVHTVLQYPEKELQVYFEGNFYNARHGEMLEFMGSEATLYLDRSRMEIFPEPGRTRKHEDFVLDRDARGADFSKVDGELLHLTNWIDCVRSRKPPLAPAEAGVSAASAAHLANRALVQGQLARWVATS